MNLAQFIRDEAKRAEHYAELVKAVDKIAALDQHEREAKAAVAKASGELSALKASADKLKEKMAQDQAKTRQEYDAIMADAKAKAEAAIAKAKSEAESIMSAALLSREKAMNDKALAESASRNAAKALAEYQAAIKAEEDRLASIKSAIAKFTA